MKTERLATDK